MGTAAYIVGSAAQRLWGITSRERIERQLRAAGIDEIADDLATLADTDSVLLINAGYLFEVRTLSGLLGHAQSLLECADDGNIAAAHVEAASAVESLDIVTDRHAARPPDMTVLLPQNLDGFDGDLRKVEPPLLKRVTAQNRSLLEDHLYGSSYKGITDLVTKWLWPVPAKRLVKWCTLAGISPNMVTVTGLLLVIVASWMFLQGHYASGLVCGWIMTLLDTVDGKLARVTVRSSRFGHLLDHGMDIVHPPFWYVFWGMGLADFDGFFDLDRSELYWLIVGGYAGGRVIEGLFHALGDCSIFAWRPFDAYFRLFTARRNPCLIILTAALLVGHPEYGLSGVAVWTLASTAIMLVRLGVAAGVRIRTGPLESWLKDPATARSRHAAAYRTFSGTRRAYG
jgi:hypothetical protein